MESYFEYTFWSWKLNSSLTRQSHKHFSESNSIAYRDAFAQGYADGYRERMR